MDYLLSNTNNPTQTLSQLAKNLLIVAKKIVRASLHRLFTTIFIKLNLFKTLKRCLKMEACLG